MTNNAPTDRNSVAWENYWKHRGFLHDDTEHLMIRCYPSQSYGYCHDRGCIKGGCWIVLDEGTLVDKDGTPLDRYDQRSVLWDTKDIYDPERAARDVVKRWESLTGAMLPPTSVRARGLWEALAAAIQNLDDARKVSDDYDCH